MTSYRNEEIDLVALFEVIWSKKLVVLLITLSFAIASVLYAFSQPDRYISEVLLMPNEQENKAGIGSLAGQLGGIASLAGIDVGNPGISKTKYALEVLKSRRFLFKFFNDHDIKREIISSTGWDRESNELLFEKRTSQIALKKSGVSSFSDQDVYETFLKENLGIVESSETGMVKISITHYSPTFAKSVLDKIIAAINHSIKQEDVQNALKSINYLERELKETNVVGSKSVFYRLIEQQHRSLMLAKVRDEYVLKIVDPAIIPEKTQLPNRAMIIAVGGFLGVFCSLLFVLVAYFRKQPNKQS